MSIGRSRVGGIIDLPGHVRVDVISLRYTVPRLINSIDGHIELPDVVGGRSTHRLHFFGGLGAGAAVFAVALAGVGSRISIVLLLRVRDVEYLRRPTRRAL